MKKLLLFATFILISMEAFAQLTVKPVGTAGPDSFVYVKNEILYVTSDVNLTPNRTTQEEASIYLRDGGQLIQGGKSLVAETSNNTGAGFLSVQREVPVTNAYAYNDWASPVGNPTMAEGRAGNNTNFGINSVYEPLDGELGIQARVSLNIAGRQGIKSPLTISRRWLYTLMVPGTEAAGDYQRFNATNAVPAGFGYTMKGVGEANSNVNYEFRGRPNSGDFVIPIGADSDTTGETGKMTLAGNPYPSALDLNQVFYEPGNGALGEIWFYDEDRTAVPSHNYSNKPFGYGTWVPNGKDTKSDKSTNNPSGEYTTAPFYIWNEGGQHGGQTPGEGSGDKNKRYAPIGQGFRLVGEKNLGANSTVTIKNKHRIFVKEGEDTGSQFQRPDNNNNTSETNTNANRPRVRDLLSSLATTETPTGSAGSTPKTRFYVVFDDGVTRDMLITFSRNATDGYDRGYDGSSPGGLKSDAYFPIEIDGQKKPFVINGTNYRSDKKIPISFKLHKPGQINIKIAEEVRKPYRNIYLYDKQQNLYMDFYRNNDGIIFGLPAGEYNNRYFIAFQKEEVISIPWGKEALDEFMGSVAMFQNNPAQRLEVQNPEGYNIKSVNVFDMSGKLVISEKNLGDNNTYSFHTGHLSDGVYLVKLVTVDDMPIDYKAIIMNK